MVICLIILILSRYNPSNTFETATYIFKNSSTKIQFATNINLDSQFPKEDLNQFFYTIYSAEVTKDLQESGAFAQRISIAITLIYLIISFISYYLFIKSDLANRIFW